MKKAFGIVFLAVFTMFFTVGLETADAAAGGGPEAKLKGTYFRTRTRTCVLTNGNFDGSNKIINVGVPLGDNLFAHTRTNVSSGEITFDGKGSGTVEFNSMTVRHRTIPGQGNGVAVSLFGPSTCTFDYTVGSDGSFTLDNFSGCNWSGVAVQGQMAKGKKSLIFFDHDDNVETRNSGPNRNRICNRSGTAVKVNN